MTDCAKRGNLEQPWYPPAPSRAAVARPTNLGHASREQRHWYHCLYSEQHGAGIGRYQVNRNSAAQLDVRRVCQSTSKEKHIADHKNGWNMMLVRCSVQYTNVNVTREGTNMTGILFMRLMHKVGG
jgi:hypothetical protein